MNEKKNKQLDSLKMFRTLVKKNVKSLKDDDFTTGNLVSFSYIAKDKQKVWDKTPLIFVLWRTKGYTLGLNFHWFPKKVRYIILDFILKKNKKNIKDGKPIKITYKEIKPILVKLKLKAIVRLYINKRISKKGILIPQEYMRKAIDLPAENFIGMSADKAYSLMVRKSKR
jgi:hypothetical protein